MDRDYAEFLTKLKAKNDIVEVIGSYVKLDRKGSNFWACCPFHHEKTPSFAVNAPEQYYHCFGCGASGDVIRFVQEYENIGHMDAVKILAQRAGMEVPAFSGGEKDGERVELLKKKKDTLLAILKASARFYLANLYSGKADKYLAYLSSRKLSPTTVKKFGLGASLDFKSLPAYLLDSGFSEQDILDSGVCQKRENGGLYDAEGERLIYPIINHMDEVIAFGGRVLEKSDRAKYKNTRETVIFNKSKNLYNINLVKKLKRESGVKNLIMVEGYMDAISLYQAGFPNVVASMGTSLTKEQARLCRRYSDLVLISYDGDFAGQSANLRGLKILKDEGITVRVVPMPEGLDPDDVIKQTGTEGYKKCLEAAMPLIDFRLLAEKRNHDLENDYERREYAAAALGIVGEAENEVEREQLLRRISEETGLSVTALSRDLEGVKKGTPPAPPRPEKGKEEPPDRDLKAARFVLAASLLSKPYAMDTDILKIGFSNEEHRKIAEYISEGRKNGTVRASGLFDLMDPEGELKEILNLDFGDNLDGESAERFFSDSVKALKRRYLDGEIARLNLEYGKAETSEKKREIALLLNELARERKNV